MKNILLILTIALVCNFAIAQQERGDLTLAPQLGLNLSNYNSNDVDLSNDIRVAFNIGVIGEYYFSNRWSIRSGLLYDSKGTVVKQNGDNIDKLNYLAIPLHANWHFGKRRGWFLNFGPTLGVLLSANAELADGDEFDISEEINSFDLGLGIGIGHKFMLSENTEFFIHYQGFSGLLPLNANSSGFGDTNINLLNVTSAFNAGVVFQL